MPDIFNVPAHLNDAFSEVLAFFHEKINEAICIKNAKITRAEIYCGRKYDDIVDYFNDEEVKIWGIPTRFYPGMSNLMVTFYGITVVYIGVEDE